MGILDLTSANHVIQDLRKSSPEHQHERIQHLVDTSDAESNTSDSDEEAEGPVMPSAPPAAQPDVTALNAPEPPEHNRLIPPQTETQTAEGNFHHPRNVRRKIKRGRPTTRLSTAENSSRDPVVGNSQNGFKLKSSEIQNNPNLHLVYVGRLAKNTSENDVRTHLHEISVTNQSIADVIKLKCRKDNETSFCISLNDTSAQDTLFRSEKWPRGVIVRPFTQNPKKNTKSEQNRRYRDNRQSVPPRLRKQVRLEERAVPVRSRRSRQVEVESILSHINLGKALLIRNRLKLRNGQPLELQIMCIIKIEWNHMKEMTRFTVIIIMTMIIMIARTIASMNTRTMIMME